MLGFDGSPGLGTGTMREDFQLSGNIPVERDMLKISVIIGEIEDAVSFNMRADILSRPIALLTLSDENQFVDFFLRTQDAFRAGIRRQWQNVHGCDWWSRSVEVL